MVDWKKKKDLGAYGENLVTDLVRRQGKNVWMSSDDFDRKGDLFFDEEKLLRFEVKTQPAFYTKNWFTIRGNQLKKCLEATAVYWVSVPLVERPNYTHACKIFESSNPSLLAHFVAGSYKDGTTRIAFPIDQDGIKLIHKIVNEADIKELIRLRSMEKN